MEYVGTLWTCPGPVGPGRTWLTDGVWCIPSWKPRWQC